MTRTILFIALAIIIFFVLYELYTTRRFNRPRQIILSVIGALILAYILYTCQSDDQ